jgi:hypothetical protein
MNLMNAIMMMTMMMMIMTMRKAQAYAHAATSRPHRHRVYEKYNQTQPLAFFVFVLLVVDCRLKTKTPDGQTRQHRARAPPHTWPFLLKAVLPIKPGVWRLLAGEPPGAPGRWANCELRTANWRLALAALAVAVAAWPRTAPQGGTLGAARDFPKDFFDT